MRTFKILFIYLAMLSLRSCVGFFLVVTSRSYALVAVCGLLITVASLVAEHGFQGAWASVVVAPALWNTGSVVVTHGLSRSAACGILPDWGSNLCLLHWPVDSLLENCQGSL